MVLESPVFYRKVENLISPACLSAHVLNFLPQKYAGQTARFLPVCYANKNFPEIVESILPCRQNIVAGHLAHPDLHFPNRTVIILFTRNY